jgi:alginate O-acetyltransferase complex protein AlgI
MSYSIDIYRGKVKPTKSFFQFACYVSLFPQLIAGPIVRYSEIMADLENIDRLEKMSRFRKGLSLFVVGLAKKIIIADNIAAIIDPLLVNYQTLTFLTAWLAVIGFAYQLYFDFSGYSDMAIGLGHLLGFNFPQNFNSPYKSQNISEFWRRWHMSLSRWVNDYIFLSLYRPKIKKIRLYINIIITMFLLGIWHGAGYTFVVFGLYHGTLTVLYHMTKRWYDKLPKLFKRTFTMFIVVVGFMIFRSTSMDMVFVMFQRMFDIFSISSIYLNMRLIVLILFIIFSFILTTYFKNTNELNYSDKKRLAVILAILFIISIILMGKGEVVFLYYQF